MCACVQCTLIMYFPNPQEHSACYTTVLREWGSQGHGLVCITVHIQGRDSPSPNLSISGVFITHIYYTSLIPSMPCFVQPETESN